jgi:hypothetical protein
MNNEFNTGTMNSLGHASIDSNSRLQVGNNYTYNYNTTVGSNVTSGTPHQQTPVQEVMEYASRVFGILKLFLIIARFSEIAILS